VGGGVLIFFTPPSVCSLAGLSETCAQCSPLIAKRGYFPSRPTPPPSVGKILVQQAFNEYILYEYLLYYNTSTSINCTSTILVLHEYKLY